MSDINSITLTGFMATDPNGKAITTKAGKDTFLTDFRLGFKSDWRKDAKATFITVKVWGAHGKFVADYGSKGTQVCVLGKLQEETWTGSDGEAKSRWAVIAETVLLPRAPKGERNEPSTRIVDYKRRQEDDQGFEPIEATEEEMPF